MPAVKVREAEPFENALRRFKKQCEKAGVLVGSPQARILRKTEREAETENYRRQKESREGPDVARYLRTLVYCFPCLT